MTRQQRTSRREFLTRTAVGAAAAPLFVTSAALGAEGRPAASDRIAMGAIGVGGRGGGNMRGFTGFPEVQMLAVCDVVEKKREGHKNWVNQRQGNKDCAAYNDFRALLGRGDIDAICVGTPDHWHAIPTIEACKHGIDVFCEKPLSLTIREGRAMVSAARRYGRVFSSGSQRVWGDYGRLATYINSGAIGEVKEAYVGVGGPSKPCFLGSQPVPKGIDWEMWLGPAPKVPFHHGRLNFRPWRDYSGGSMTDWGGHKFGAVIFAMGLQETGPVEIIPPDDEHKYLTYVYANGFRMHHRGARDITYVGTKGKASRGNMNRPMPNPVHLPRYKGRGGIKGDFLHCVKTRQRPFRDVEFGHRAATVCHLGNIAYWLKRPLKWDPEKEDIIGDPEAARWLDRPKRGRWRT